MIEERMDDGVIRCSMGERIEEGGVVSWIHPRLICIMALGFSF